MDPDGRALHVAIGALTGAIISTAVSMGGQQGTNGKIDLKTTAVAFVSGAMSGALAATGVGLAGQIVGNAVLAGASYVADEGLTDGNLDDVNLKDATINMVVGGIAGKLGGKGVNVGKNLSSPTKNLFKRVVNDIKNNKLDDIPKAVINFSKNTKKGYTELLKGVAKSNIPPAVQGAASTINKKIREVTE